MEAIKSRVFILIVFTFISLVGCGEKRSTVERKALEEEMRDREIKKVSEVEITEAALQRGALLADTAQKILASALASQIQQNGVEEAIEFCHTNAYPLIDSLASLHHTSIRRVSLKARNPKNRPDALEAALLDAYQYNIENDIPLNENVQEIEDGYILYSKPILLQNPLCLNCHGEIGEDISPKVNEKISSLYPDDQAHGYRLGEFRGMWSIKLSKKEIVKAL